MTESITIPKNSDVAVICEGNAERNYLSILLEANLLKFDRNQLIKEQLLGGTYRGKTKFRDEFLTMSYDEPITLLQVQDTNKKIKFNSPYVDKIGQHLVIRTKPELEILLIHHLDLYEEFNKVKSKHKPSSFLANYLGIKQSNLKSKKFIMNTWDGETLYSAIEIYNSKIRKEEYGLIDLLKETEY